MNKASIIVSIVAAAMLSACGSTEFAAGGGKKPAPEQSDNDALPRTVPEDPQVKTESFTSQVTGSSTAALDVIFAIDTSGSMFEEAEAVNNNLAAFLRKFSEQNIDARVTVIGDSVLPPGTNTGGVGIPDVRIPSDLPKDRIAQYKKMVDSNNAIGVLNSFFASTKKPLALRQDAVLEIVVVSDDNGLGKGNRAQDFIKPSARAVHFNGIVGLDSSPNSATCSIAAPGKEYEKLAEDTDGSIFDLCSPDWTQLMDQLSGAIISRVSDMFVLSSDPDLSQAIIVAVNGQELDESDFTLEGRNLKILTAINSGDKVTVTYYPQQ